MAELEAAVRGIDRDGLVWGTSKLVAVGFGIKKLQINVVVEDEKVSTQDLEDEIEGFDDYVQSCDIVGSCCLRSNQFVSCQSLTLVAGYFPEAVKRL